MVIPPWHLSTLATMGESTPSRSGIGNGFETNKFVDLPMTIRSSIARIDGGQRGVR